MKKFLALITLELTCADIPETLKRLANAHIGIQDVQYVDELSLVMTIAYGDYRKLCAIAEKYGDSIRLLHKVGVYWDFLSLAPRVVLLSGIAVMIALTLMLPKWILFVEVEGNETVSVNQILEAAEQSGIRFGASRREVRSERVKNAMLEQLPALSWVGVNTRGCVAFISVRERSETQEEVKQSAVSNIVASADGVIISATATSGDLLCAPGQAVKKGEVLISGYTDCGISIRAQRAEGEIIARTRHTITVKMPLHYLKRTEIKRMEKNYSLIIGKKRINLRKNSGILDAECGRMYEEKVITLPGGFQLPIIVAIETVTVYETVSGELQTDVLRARLEDFAQRYAVSQMIAGTVDGAHLSFRKDENNACLQAVFLCTEMIGREKSEQMGESYG